VPPAPVPVAFAHVALYRGRAEQLLLLPLSQIRRRLRRVGRYESGDDDSVRAVVR
jgi:hypothetical protein